MIREYFQMVDQLEQISTLNKLMMLMENAKNVKLLDLQLVLQPAVLVRLLRIIAKKFLINVYNFSN